MKHLIFLIMTAASCAAAFPNETYPAVTAPDVSSSNVQNPRDSMEYRLKHSSRRQPSKPVNPDDMVESYNWSGLHNKYCYFNKKGEVISCP